MNACKIGTCWSSLEKNEASADNRVKTFVYRLQALSLLLDKENSIFCLAIDVNLVKESIIIIIIAM